MIPASGALLMSALLTTACRSPAFSIRPVIYSYDGGAAAMKNAPIILLVRISDARLTGDARTVAKPADIGGPQSPTVPLHLAEIDADVMLAVRGQAPPAIRFYSWIWASGSHGGPRLFHPDLGGARLLFLREEGGYLRTVGDYPSYDLEVYSVWLPRLLSAWNSGLLDGTDPLARFVGLRLRAEFESLTGRELREHFDANGPTVNHHWVLDLHELVRLAGPYFVASQVDDICLRSENPTARFAACYVAAKWFPGRCEGYQLARQATPDAFGAQHLDRRLHSCQKLMHYWIGNLQPGAAQRWAFHGASMAPQHRRETLRVYASAYNPKVRRAACEAAATLETRGLPECAFPLQASPPHQFDGGNPHGRPPAGATHKQPAF